MVGEVTSNGHVEVESDDYSGILAVVSARERRSERRAFLAIGAAVLACVAVVVLAVVLGLHRQQNQVEPYLVGVTEDSRVIVIGKLERGWHVSHLQTAGILRRWIKAVRGLTTDEVQVIEERKWAWSMMVEPGATQLRTQYAALPLDQVGKFAIAVKMEGGAPPVGGRTYEMRWTEERTDLNSRSTSLRKFIGFFTIKVRPPKVLANGTIDAAEAEHLGVYIESFSVEERP
jgi:type IV secretory pathway TrbF-like protein